MDQISLHCTGPKVSRAALGTMTFSDQADERACIRVLDCTLDSGINFVDTANIYARGAPEESLGRALKGRRNQIVLARKVWGCVAGEGRLDVPSPLSELERYGRRPNRILELWTPYQESVAETVALEEKWARRSIRYLQQLA
jgi:aryl-alcohol dehydrogenase-like predicted oxidoreductase